LTNELEVKLTDHLLDPEWRRSLAKEFEKAYFKQILAFLENEKRAGKIIFPSEEDIFQAFNLTPLSKVKAVILGQDPYIFPNQAHGLCFSVKKGVRSPPSLVNIFQELKNDIPNFIIPRHGNLESWARNGVLLLNSSLTVEAGKSNSHVNIGWLQFTDAVIRFFKLHPPSSFSFFLAS